MLHKLNAFLFLLLPYCFTDDFNHVQLCLKITHQLYFISGDDMVFIRVSFTRNE